MEAKMNCPVCGERLREVQKYGVDIDICPGCKGVWLDRGELDKIIAMVSSGQAEPQQVVQETNASGTEKRYQTLNPFMRGHDEDDYDEHGRRPGHDDDELRDGHDYNRGGRRKKSWLSDMFDGLGGD
jgi:uncharacterized protein